MCTSFTLKIPNMRALVISGGGSKGAFAGGVAEYLLRDCGKDYDILVGTSTGSLLVPLLALGEIDRLKQVYTTVRQRDVFSICPFVIRKQDGVYHTRINHINTLRMFLRRRKTFGESTNLRKLIGRTYLPEDHRRLQASHKKVSVTVSNLTHNRKEYKLADTCSYEDFCDWMWLSSNLVPFMSLGVKNGDEYADGGFGSLIPVQQAIDLGAREVDVIVLQPKANEVETTPVENAFDSLLKTFDFMLTQIGKDDVVIGNLASRVHQVSIFTYHTPRLLTDNAFVFDPEQMAAWWQEGYEFAKEFNPDCHCLDPVDPNSM